MSGVRSNKNRVEEPPVVALGPKMRENHPNRADPIDAPPEE
jgi:hypothetical protein